MANSYPSIHGKHSLIISRKYLPLPAFIEKGKKGKIDAETRGFSDTLCGRVGSCHIHLAHDFIQILISQLNNGTIDEQIGLLSIPSNLASALINFKHCSWVKLRN